MPDPARVTRIGSLAIGFTGLSDGSGLRRLTSAVMLTGSFVALQFFQHLDSAADTQHGFVHAGTLSLHSFEFGLARFEFLPQRLKSILYLLLHRFIPFSVAT